MRPVRWVSIEHFRHLTESGLQEMSAEGVQPFVEFMVEGNDAAGETGDDEKSRHRQAHIAMHQNGDPAHLHVVTNDV